MTKETREQRVQRDLTIAFRAVFGDPDAVRSREQLVVLAHLRRLANPGRSQWAPGQDDTALAFAQGKLRMWHEIDKRVMPQEPNLGELLGYSAEATGANDDE